MPTCNTIYNTAIKFIMQTVGKVGGGGGRCPPNLKLGGGVTPLAPPPPRFLRLWNAHCDFKCISRVDLGGFSMYVLKKSKEPLFGEKNNENGCGLGCG